MQAAAAGTGVRLSDGSTNVLPVGDAEDVARGLGEPPPPGPPLAGARLLPGLGPAPGPAADAVRRDVRVLPRGAGPRARPARGLRRARRGRRSPTSRRPPARWRGTSCAASDCGAVDEAEVLAARPRDDQLFSLSLQSTQEHAMANSPGTPTSTARRRTASSASSATPRATRSATSTCRRRCAVTSPTRTSPATRRGAADRHPEEHRVRLRQDPRDRLDRGLRAGARPPADRGVPGGERGAGAGRGVRLGPDRRPLVRAPRRRGPHLRGHRRPRRDPRAVRRPGAGAAQLDRLGVQGLPQGRVHDAARDRRPDPGDLAGREVAAHRARDGSTGTRRTTRSWRLLLETFAGTYSRALQETLHAMGCAVLDAQPGIAEITVLGAQQAPLPRRLLRLRRRRADQRRRGVHRRRPALRPDRGAGDRDDAPPAGDAWLHVPGFC